MTDFILPKGNNPLKQFVYVYRTTSDDGNYNALKFWAWLETASVFELQDILMRYNRLRLSSLAKVNSGWGYGHFIAQARHYENLCQSIRVVIAVRLGKLHFIDGTPRHWLED